jgi:hypothetical protein
MNKVIKEFDERIERGLRQVWENQKALKGELDAAEFHLRAYRHLLADTVDQINNMGEVVTKVIELEMEMPGREEVEGTKVPKKIVDMSHYFQIAQKEMDELEKNDKSTAERNNLEVLLSHYSSLPEEQIEEVLKRVEGGERQIEGKEGEMIPLTDESSKVIVAMLRMGLAMRAEIKDKVLMSQHEDMPEGAAIFGGYDGSHSRNEGQEEGTCCCGEDGASCEFSESAVPEVQTGDGGSVP